MRKRTKVLAGSVLILASITFAQQMMPATPVSKEFPHVLATVDLQPGQSASITVPDAYFTGAAPGAMTIFIPSDAFANPVTFQLLASSNSRWDAMVASGQKVVANFAYRVVDRKTGQPLEAFKAPLTYTVSDTMIDSHSIYWAVKPGSAPKLIDANAASKIHGNVLAHGTPTAAVGWIITTPKADLKAMMSGAGQSGGMAAGSGGSSSASSSSKSGM